MDEEENYTDINISEIVDDSEQYGDIESNIPDTIIDTMDFDTVAPADLDSEAVSEDQVPEKRPQNQAQKTEVVRSTRLPIARIKHIMKMDPDVNIIHQDALFLVTKATEMFLETMVKETHSYLPKNKKTINKKELDLVINKVDCLCFLEGAMDF